MYTLCIFSSSLCIFIPSPPSPPGVSIALDFFSLDLKVCEWVWRGKVYIGGLGLEAGLGARGGWAGLGGLGWGC